MKKKYPRSSTLPTASSNDIPGYISWEGNMEDRDRAFSAMGEAIDAYTGITNAGRYNDYSDLATNVSGRPGLTRRDYGLFRPDEATPVKPADIMRKTDIIYNRVGLIKNVMDLMGDFTCQGIRIVHPNKKIERFHRRWWRQVHGTERSERFSNYLYRKANVPLRRLTARISVKQQENMSRSIAGADMKIEPDKVVSREIPWKYVFYDPLTIEIVGGALSSFVGKPTYGLKLPEHMRRVVLHPKGAAEKALVNSLPAEIIQAAHTRKPILLPEDKFMMFHYKKDDWNQWAFPMIYAIMDDINLLEKLKLADLSALDGAISNIRIFKLGNIEAKIAPNKAAAQKLAEVLENHTGGGTMDLVWGPDIELIESKTQVHRFLGEEKYKPTLNNIYAGLGIPPTLTGTFGAAGTTNNFISLKTLVQRLEYGRDVLREFWHHELELVQKAMGFRFPARIEFAWNSLGDEAAEKALLLQMSDRSLISDELFHHYYGNDGDMEKIRLKRESVERDKGNRVPKSSPYHDPQFQTALKKIALQTGVVTPSQIGLDLPAPKKGEQPALKMKEVAKPKTGQTTKKKGQPQQGRPKNSKDTKKRQTKTFKPKSKAKAVVEIWATAAQHSIAECLNAGLLAGFGKKNLRSLTASQQDQAEIIRFGVLCHLPPCGIVDEQTILAALEDGAPPTQFTETYTTMARDITVDLDRTLTVDEFRQVQVCAYTAIMGD